ncbi:PREDICTED: uncharacterized protein K02A2.6-like [Vollenhovia emeryi]|uniref:uncharacterized protein K02A2.6-like n=1 Tax=Vollenhovia emeryi TaxID=411798 RepID=UPI0005F4E80F|nr:PREDICTED: uncharacterized protein K02A2.6-like [Vollenhovia emeryi]
MARSSFPATLKRFCELNGIKHITSAPYHPQSNGRAERFVGLLKEGLQKLRSTGNPDEALRKFLMCYRYTPSYELGGKSPFQLMTGREMKTRLDLVKPPSEPPATRKGEMEARFNAHHGAK